MEQVSPQRGTTKEQEAKGTSCCEGSSVLTKKIKGSQGEWFSLWDLHP